MYYPKDFIEAVRNVYPKDEYLHALLTEPADTKVGEILRKAIMPPIHSLTPLQKMEFAHITAEGERIMIRLATYQRWVQIYYSTPGNMHVRRGGEHLKTRKGQPNSNREV